MQGCGNEPTEHCLACNHTIFFVCHSGVHSLARHPACSLNNGFSFLRAGTQTIGDGSGCTWKTQGIDKAINASCLYDRIDSNIETYDATAKACFSACPPCTPPNCTDARMTDCYLKCYSATSGRMSHTELTVPWMKAFQGEDPTDGGCPLVHQICPVGSQRPGCPHAGRAQ